MLAVGIAALTTAAWPRFSWDTVPVFYHSCNFSGPFSDHAIEIMAKFPMVTIEKGQGVVNAGCVCARRRANACLVPVLLDS